MSAVYHTLMAILDKFVPKKVRPLWNHPAGPKTIFFWAPIGKWALVLAGLRDIRRPVEKMSMPQSLALVCSGCIWSRYSLVIVPKNYTFFFVNTIVAVTGFYQVTRIAGYKARNGLSPRASPPESKG